MSAQPEALRLAAELEACPSINYKAHADELRRLHADAEESEALRERLSELLRNTAIALRGPEPELTSWSWHDLPELATALKAQRDALLEACRFYASMMGRRKSNGEPFYMTALDLDCGDRARAAIKSVEGEGA